MKTEKRSLSIRIVLTIMIVFCATSQAGEEPKYASDVPESVTTPDVVRTKQLGKLEFFDGMPNEATVQKVYDHLDFSRGVEAFLSGIPAASIYGLLEGFKDAGLKPNNIGITEELMDARSLFLTANSTTMYCFGELNLKDGPVVIELPPGVLGLVNDSFFRYVTDLGLSGSDKGQGGKYLFLPPGYEGNIPDGYFVFRSPTYRNLMMFRGFIKGGDFAGTANAIKSRFRMYPLTQAKNPPKLTFVNLSGKKYNTIHANDFTFYEELNSIIQYEPADAFNPELVGLFASIGIKKGQPFAPDKRMKKILTDAAAVGNATSRAISFAPRTKDVYFYSDRNWYSPFAGGSHEFMNDGEQVLDDRTFFHYIATCITPAMARSQVGVGSAYAFTAHDSKGKYLDGGKTYKITLPAPIPAKDFWSFTVYSGQHRSMLETDQKLAGVDSNQDGIKANADGSYTVWFGPKAPEGKESNWVQTMPGKSWNCLLRLYGPLEPWFDKTWKPGDFVKVK